LTDALLPDINFGASGPKDMRPIQADNCQHFPRKILEQLLTGWGVQGASPNFLTGQVRQARGRLMRRHGVQHHATLVRPQMVGNPAV
jgi:hypothetical protein